MFGKLEKPCPPPLMLHCGLHSPCQQTTSLYLCIQGALTQAASKFPAHLNRLAETSFYVNSQTDPCKPSDKHRAYYCQGRWPAAGNGQLFCFLYATVTSVDLHLACRITSRMPETSGSGRRRRVGGIWPGERGLRFIIARAAMLLNAS